ncbi:hypothetical protein ACFV2U_30370, partial [Streptomyces sp. NPDC059697]|uniref:hypothetical protein n=1 Tax=Streptomyces sp. NPDC059697 TaxID=3346912 RepID=UPI0036BB6A7D
MPSTSGRTSVSRSAARRAPASRARSPLPTQRGHGDEDRHPLGGEGGRRAALCEVLGEGVGTGEGATASATVDGAGGAAGRMVC